jgi:Trp operon repressor
MDEQSGSMSSWDYLDFELEIRESESRGYAVAVHSPAGEAQEEMSFPFDERQLRDKLKDLEIALLRSGGTRRSLSTEEQTVQNFGRSLFEAVLVGKVGTCYYRSMDQAQQEGKGLRLKLHVKPPNLTVLPWEFLYDPDRDEYLCFSRDTPIVRYTDLRQPVGRLTVEPPLRILGMVASPRDLAPLDVEHEKGLMDEAIEGLHADGLVKLTWLEGETWRDLQRAMRRDGPWHIFHFVGHGDFDLSAQEGLIAFTEKGTGRRHLLRSRDLARLVDGHPSLRLVFLNSCEGARGSEGDPFSGTAATLVRRGIPAVVAMQYQITDKSAIEFCSAFYESLADGLPVDAAVTEARVAVSMDSMLEWGTPVLYMRSRDGRLFDISTDKRHSEQPPGITEQEELHEHQERTDREKERKERLDTLYAQARRSHQNQEWQAVVDVFEQISAEDPDYPDPEGLLQSALEALKRVRKEQDALRRYREAVKSTSKEGLDERRAQSLRDLANKLELSASAASRIEQEVMDNTKEAILERLEGLYDEARQLHQNREWQAVLDIFARIYLEDANYPDPEGLLATAHEALEKASKEEASLRQYREVVASAWADGVLDSREVERLRDLADKLDLSPSHTGEIERTVTGDTKEAILESQERAAKERYRKVVEEAWADDHVSDADTEQLGTLASELDLSMDTVAAIERDVMGDTKEAILERQEQVAREKERQDRLDQLYARARRSHQNQEWQAVLDIFAEIHAEDPDYPDPNGLLASAREALEIAQKKEDALRQYREGVESAWTSGELDRRQAERLRDLANEHGLNSSAAAGIEREVMGETIEELLDRREQASAEHYRTAVEEAWTDNQLSNAEAKWLSTIASELGLSTDSAADIEREIIGDTIPAILQRRRRLDELYTQARQSHEGQEWQMVVDVFERIHSEDPTFSDPEGLLESAREALDRMRKVAGLYEQALGYVDGSEWQQALECFEEVQRLERGYRDTEELLARVRRELAPPPTVEVPDISGQEIFQASRALTGNGLKLGAQREVPSDTVPEGQIVEHSPDAGREVQSGTSVNVTISSGPSTVEIPDIVGKSCDEARTMLHAAGLRLGMVGNVPSNKVVEANIVEQYPAAGGKVEWGTSVRVMIAQRRIEELAVEMSPKRPFYPRPDSLPDEPEAESQVESSSQRSEKRPSEREGKPEKPQDLPD